MYTYIHDGSEMGKYLLQGPEPFLNITTAMVTNKASESQGLELT